MNGLMAALGAITTSLTMDKQVYRVGDKPTYTIVAAVPGSKVYWTSFKDGKTTGEHNAFYGGVVGANGTVELPGGAFTEADVGRWEKQGLIITPDDTQELTQVFFVVTPVSTATTTPAPAPSTTPVSSGGIGDVLSGSVDIGGYEVPYWAIGTGAVGLFFLSQRK